MRFRLNVDSIQILLVESCSDSSGSDYIRTTNFVGNLQMVLYSKFERLEQPGRLQTHGLDRASVEYLLFI